MVAATSLTFAAIAALIVWKDATPPINTPLREASSFSREPITALPAVADLDAQKVALGKRLFQDARLSGDGRTSCLSCHDLATNGAQAGRRTTKLDAPTVFNAALNFRFGWEGQFRTLEGQTLATLKSPIMSKGVALDSVIERLRADSGIRAAFQRTYGRDPDTGTLLDALASFERSLITPGSRFDRWLQGDASALSAREQQGYALFNKLGCASCHQGRNIGGNLYQRHGVFRPLASPEPSVVRVPSLRNIAVTAPYFHDGSAATIESAIWRMANAQLDRRLTRDEVDLVAAYLRTLTGRYEGEPLRAAQ